MTTELPKKGLDFFVIGGQRCGTTSLFKYLEGHPRLHMPPEKEAPFFNKDERFSKGLEWYLAEFFGDAPSEALWGTVTPDYMADPRVPERMAELVPEAKLIAVLRHPVERAFSHYRMSVSRGWEARSFGAAIAEQLTAGALNVARRKPDPVNSYVVRGEYARILRGFYDHFSGDAVAVFFLEELRETPTKVVRQIFRFLDVGVDFTPPNLGVVYHKGGSKRRWSWVDRLKELDGLRPAWHSLPGRWRRPFSYWFKQWNIVPDAEGEVTCSRRIAGMLADHYLEDAQALAALVGCPVPWNLEALAQGGY